MRVTHSDSTVSRSDVVLCHTECFSMSISQLLITGLSVCSPPLFIHSNSFCFVLFFVLFLLDTYCIESKTGCHTEDIKKKRKECKREECKHKETNTGKER